MSAAAPTWSACSASTRRPTARTRSTRRERNYVETNCYTDILIELLHARGDEPLAMMGCVLADRLRGRPVDVLQAAARRTWSASTGSTSTRCSPTGRGRPDRRADRPGRTMIVELDSWYLPDTAATSYRTEHVKSCVIAEAIDPEGERLRYFHGAWLLRARGRGLPRRLPLGQVSDDVLPPYTELVRLDAGARCGARSCARPRAELLASISRGPPDNPFVRFGEQLGRELPRLLEGDAAGYHDYAFATVRMVGSAFEAGASHVEWVLGERGAAAAAAMGRIVEGCKTLSFKLARRREFDPGRRDGCLAAWTRRFASSTMPSPDSMAPGARPSRPGRGPRPLPLVDGWEAASMRAGRRLTPAISTTWLDRGDRARHRGCGPACRRARSGRPRRRGLVVSHLRGRPAAAGEEVVLRLDGIATVAEVFLNGRLLLPSDSMFPAHAVDVGAPRARRQRAGDPLPGPGAAAGGAAQPARPLAHQAGRGRPALLPHDAARPHPASRPGPRRSVPGGRSGSSVAAASRSTSSSCAPGSTATTACSRSASGSVRSAASARGRSRSCSRPGRSHAAARGSLAVDRTGDRLDRGERKSAFPGRPLVAAHPRRAALHEVRLLSGRRTRTVDAGRVGFRELAAGARAGHDVERRRPRPARQRVRVFARGAVWTPVDIVGLAPRPRGSARRWSGSATPA